MLTIIRNWIYIGILFAFVVYSIFVGCNYINNQEISAFGYTDVVKIKNGYPEVKEIINKCMEDGKISHSEYGYILSERDRVKKASKENTEKQLIELSKKELK